MKRHTDVPRPDAPADKRKTVDVLSQPHHAASHDPGVTTRLRALRYRDEPATPVEAAALEKPILFGPGMGNFRALARDLVMRGAAREVVPLDHALEALAGQVETAKVGWRLMLAGPEIDVLRACAVAHDGGALASEIGVAVVESPRRRVWCVHCGTTTEATA